ncbi:r3H domain protein [Mycoplasma sp. CAG:877]|jgi:spoIIIJ-associated protein|nr:r3H domain protein [Mycoplasma sp. CAG:877]
MEKHRYTGKTKEEAISNATIDLQETQDNLIIKELEEIKGGLFKSKKVEIEVIERREVVRYIKEYLQKLLKDLGFTSNIEIKNKEEVPTYTIYSDNDALLIGKNGKNLKALSILTSQHLLNELGRNFKFTIDINSYKEKREKSLESLARRIAREVATTKVEAKLDSMNSYERRIIHNALTNNKRVYTESEGEEPNRYVVIKPREE